MCDAEYFDVQAIARFRFTPFEITFALNPKKTRASIS